MIFSVFDYANRCYSYYQAPGTCPPHGWFRPPAPGQLRQPEEMAARLPEGATLIGSGPTARGIIATDIPGVGTIDHSTPPSGRETGLGGPHDCRGFVPPRERPHQAAFQRVFQRGTSQEWDSTSRGWDVR